MSSEREFVPVAGWRAMFETEIRASFVELRNIQFLFDPSELPAIPTTRATLELFTDGEPTDIVLLNEVLVDFFSRFFAIFVGLAADPDTNVLPEEQQRALRSLAFRLSGAIEAVVLVRRINGATPARFDARVLMLERTEHAAERMRLSIAERRDVYMTHTILYSDVGRPRGTFRIKASQLFVEAVYRHARDESNVSRILRWGETSFVRTFVEQISLLHSIAGDRQPLAEALASVMRSAMRGGTFRPLLARLGELAYGFATALRASPDDADTEQIIQLMRTTVSRLANRAGAPRNLPLTMTLSEAFRLFAMIVAALHDAGGRATRALVQAIYGPDPFQYENLDYLEEPNGDSEEDTNGNGSSSSTNGNGTSDSDSGPDIVARTAGSGLIHL